MTGSIVACVSESPKRIKKFTIATIVHLQKGRAVETTQPIQLDQRKRLMEIGSKAVGIVLNELNLSVKEAGRAVEDDDELLEALTEAASRTIENYRASKYPVFASYLEADRGYPLEFRVKPLTEQVIQLCTLFPGLGFVNADYHRRVENKEIRLPEHADGWFGIPNLANPSVRSIFGGKSYSRAFSRVLLAMDDVFGKVNRDSKAHNLSDTDVVQLARTKRFFAKMSEEQGNPDILIVASQFGRHHRCHDARDVRATLEPNECCLGVFATGCMLLTHPERLANRDKLLWVYCPGDVFGGNEVGVFIFGPKDVLSKDVVKFFCVHVYDGGEYSGPVTAFLTTN